VFFGELREIKAIIKDKGKRIKVKRDNVGAVLAPARNKKKGRKMKFRPEITRVKLNPEQAVLTCSCYQGGKTRSDLSSFAIQFPPYSETFWCKVGERTRYLWGGFSASPTPEQIVSPCVSMGIFDDAVSSASS